MRALYENVAQQCQRDSFIINSGWIPAQDKNSINFKTLPTAQRTLGFSALTKVTFIGLITSSDINLDEKIQLWNLDKGSTSKPQTNISLEILTKLQHTQWTSTSKSRLYLVVEVQKNVSFENLTKLQPWYLTKLQNLYHTALLSTHCCLYVWKKCQRDSFIINSGWIPTQDKDLHSFLSLLLGT